MALKQSRVQVGGNQGRHIPPAIKDGWPAPLYTKDGGHSFRSGVVFPITKEDELPTPEQASNWTTWAMRIFALISFICVIVFLTKVYPIAKSYW